MDGAVRVGRRGWIAVSLVFHRALFVKCGHTQALEVRSGCQLELGYSSLRLGGENMAKALGVVGARASLDFASYKP